MSDAKSRGEFIAAGALVGALGLAPAAGARTGATTLLVVGHGTDAYTPRPSATVVLWVGTVRPRRMNAARDVWWNDPKVELAEPFPPPE